MQNRRFLAVLGILVGLILLAGTCSAGFVAGRMYTGQPAAGQAELPARLLLQSRRLPARQRQRRAWRGSACAQACPPAPCCHPCLALAPAPAGRQRWLGPGCCCRPG